MESAQSAQRSARSRSLKVGVVDLIERQRSTTFYGRVLNPNFAAIMPQVVAVWAEQLGHQVEYVTYTGYEDLRRELPRDVDIVFINSFTQAAYLAYSISNFYRKQNVVTVLGGPHARAYAEDSGNYFDYVIGMADKTVIADLLSDFSPNPSGGVQLTAKQQPASLPGVRERWKYVRKTLDKTKILHLVQILGSLGCPYKCDFCIDSEVDYQTMPYDQLREDLAFLQNLPKPPKVAWVDPNFGVRFDEYMEVIESSVKPGALDFAAESSLSLLSEPHLKRMKHNGFVLILPGIESWFDYNNKSKQGKHVGMEKVRAVADHVNMIMRRVSEVFNADRVRQLSASQPPIPSRAARDRRTLPLSGRLFGPQHRDEELFSGGVIRPSDRPEEVHAFAEHDLEAIPGQYLSAGEVDESGARAFVG
jgi:hypothetical protein